MTLTTRIAPGPAQTSLFTDEETRPAGGLRIFPSTRYQGSKAKLVDWIWSAVADLEFDTVLDAFGGTGCVAYRMKCEGKETTYNDVLRWNEQCGLALIENSSVRLPEEQAAALTRRHPGVAYPTFIADTFGDIYFLDEENVWLDTVVTNIRRLSDPYQRALAFYALCQACIIKRPYNLFHRRNLYIRLAEVDRSFGNKTTWDTPFDEHFLRFVREANDAVFDNGKANRALCEDALELKGHWDLVYIDTPYISGKGIGVDYRDFYHFLEGMTMYDRWPQELDRASKHHRLLRTPSPWSNPGTIYAAFRAIFDRFSDSIIVVSYRSDGIPSPEQLKALLAETKRHVTEAPRREYQYALSTTNGHEMLLIGT
jgi:adenine-specific DNA methylase